MTDLALRHWNELDGYAASQNMPDLRTMTAQRFTSFVYWWATRNAESETDKAKFDAKLWQPVIGAEIPSNSPWAPENETAALSGLKAALGR